MTKLRPDSPLVRETDVYERGDALIVSLEPRNLAIRLKGHRELWYVGYGEILDLARKLTYRRSAQNPDVQKDFRRWLKARKGA
jgi:hypothetical protein